MSHPADLPMVGKRISRRLLAPTADFLRRKIAYFLPPPVLMMVRNALAQNHYEPRGWIAQEPSDGWNRESVAVAQAAHWGALVRNLDGTGPLGVSHLPTRTTREDVDDHNIMMSYGYVLARAARNKQNLSILDWGGSLGHYNLYSQALLPDVAIDYHCYEVPVLCEAGRRLQPGIHFHQGADKLAGARFDLVICSAALHFFEDWRAVAETLAQRAGGFLYITRLMTVERVPSFVVRQRSTQGYRTDFQSWCLNREELLGCVQGFGMELVREFIFAETRHVKGAPETGRCRGFLFRRGQGPSMGSRAS